MFSKAILIASLALSAPAFAQRIQGHVLGGYGVTTGSGFTYRSTQIGLGADVLVARGLGFAGDITVAADSYQAVGIGSANGIYRFLRKGRTRAYLTGGYSSASVDEVRSNPGFNVGAGIEWWRWRNLGVRFEPRYFGFNLGSHPVHIFGVRLGLVFGGGRERDW